MIILLFSCAKQVVITGGEKDTAPPVPQKSSPLNGSANFIADRIYIEFNEYIKLNNLNQKLIISPPLKKKPNIVIKGKGIQIKLDKTQLLPNTTYSFNFNDAIADNNENNSLHSYVYAFSTGDKIDSLSFSGLVSDAYTRVPVADAWVLLYDNLSDTTVYSLSPSYITKTNKEGKFLIPFVKESDYRIFSVKDNNFNYLFDLPDESIAFTDSVYRPGVEMIIANDTVKMEYKNFPMDIQLLIFKENKQAQYIKSYKRKDPQSLEIIFNSKQYSEYKVTVEDDAKAITFSKENPDTVMIFLKSEELITADQLKVICFYRDPLYADTVKTDTLLFRRPEKNLTDSTCKLIVNPIKEPHKDIIIKTGYPIATFDSKLLRLEFKSDSIYLPAEIKLKKDSLNPMQLIVKGKILEKTDYRIIVEQGFISDIYGHINNIDTLVFKSTSSSEYGNFAITFIGEKANYIVQLMQSDKVIYESISLDGIVAFQYLKPGKYIIKAIKDQNNNNRWDTGDLSIKKQPEPVIFMSTEYEIRSNWNHEIEWNPVTNTSK